MSYLTIFGGRAFENVSTLLSAADVLASPTAMIIYFIIVLVAIAVLVLSIMTLLWSRCA